MDESVKKLTEWIRNKLNSLPEKDAKGSEYRVGWQILTYLVGTAAEESTNPKVRILGESAKKAAKQSFIDYAVKKIVEWLDKPSNNPYQLSKSCKYCGVVVDSWSSYCNYCFNKI